MTAKFTDVYLKALKPEPPGYVWDALLPSFGMYVGKTKKTFVTIDRTGRRTKLGVYPDLSLSEARKRAITALGDTSGSKPTISFPNALEAYLNLPRWKPNTRRVVVSSLKPFKWRQPVHKITHEDVIQVIESIQKPSARAHALKDIKAFFNWCVPRYIDNSPCVGIRLPSQRSRERVLSNAELVQIWEQLRPNRFGNYVKLLILTGQRRGEVQHITVKDGLAHISGTHTKNGRTHIFPLPQLALPLLPAPFYSGWSNPKAKLNLRSGVTDWTLHDLRRTFASNHAQIGTPIHVIEKLLNHVSGSLSGVAGIYNRYSYLEEMRQAVQNYEDWITSEVLRHLKT